MLDSFILGSLIYLAIGWVFSLVIFLLYIKIIEPIDLKVLEVILIIISWPYWLLVFLVNILGGNKTNFR